MTGDTPAAGAASKPKGAISLLGGTAIGVGGMMGAGLYTLLGLAATTAGVWIPVAFIVGGAVSAFSVYSYAKLGAKFPSRGGAGQFLIRCFGDTVVAGGLNMFQFIGWIIAMSLYAVGFGGYAVSMLPFDAPAWAAKAFGVGLVLLVVVVNLVGSKLVGRSEQFVIAIELLILLAFIVAGLFKADPKFIFEEAGQTGALGILFAAGLLYVTYEGFGVVTNSAADMKNPARELPRAMYLSLIIVVAVYVVVSSLVVMILSVPEVEQHQGHVVAEAGLAIFGQVGFVVIGAAALLATASGVNATLFGDANLAFMMARTGQLPQQFKKKVWLGGTGGLFASAALTVAFVMFFPLSAVGQMASLAFLVIYGAVSVGHIKLRKQTGAKMWPLIAAIALNAALFALLLGYTVSTGPASTWITLLVVFVASFVLEILVRRFTGRKLVADPVGGVAEAAGVDGLRG
ncbi:APC family permease [Pseudoclavibacter sp. RFBB5]|uniref:APC family permease n=1 Tax=Pseudoclavibacter sp. RFBB5 TaxID=2080574 RepID=UPI000CE7AF6A|nr:APC family permease [Pseudoclavibacter sp. RFBB5]PPG31191.1 amino acid permease [Pseudoclavibacter sp. RFBB5]